MANLRASTSDVKSASPRRLQTFYLLTELVRRDFSSRFTGSAFGVAWAILQPLSLVLLYWFVFTAMVPRSPAAGDDGYVFFLISGLIPWLGFHEGIMRSATSIVDNGAMVRRLPLRSEILVLVPNASALLFESIAMGLFLVFSVASGVRLSNLWLLPFALLIQFALQSGLGWLLAVVHVFFRDVVQILGFVLSILFYLSPILYPVNPRYELIFRWNPMTPLIGLFRSAILGAPLPDLLSTVLLVTAATLALGGGLFFFRRAQPSLADLI